MIAIEKLQQKIKGSKVYRKKQDKSNVMVQFMLQKHIMN